MPGVFLGSLVGVKLGALVGSTVQTVVFALTVSWSIQTTYKKAVDLLAKEKKKDENLLG